MAFVDSWPGDPVRLGLQLTDGDGSRYPRATIFNGNASPVPVGAVNLDHKSLGFYRADWFPPYPGNFFAVYRVFQDPARTIEADYDRVVDSVTVFGFDQPLMGVTYDDQLDQLRADVSLTSKNKPVAPPTVVDALIEVFDADDNVLFSVADVAPDGEGVFRFLKSNPGLVEDRLYFVKITINTTLGQVIGRRGFMTAT